MLMFKICDCTAFVWVVSSYIGKKKQRCSCFPDLQALAVGRQIDVPFQVVTFTTKTSCQPFIRSQKLKQACIELEYTTNIECFKLFLHCPKALNLDQKTEHTELRKINPPPCSVSFPLNRDVLFILFAAVRTSLQLCASKILFLEESRNQDESNNQILHKSVIYLLLA